MQELLDKVGLIDFKYEKLKKKERFNIFSILRKKSDEVHVHSRFIYELLSQNGSHERGNSFATLFLQCLQIDDFDLDDYKVFKERDNIDLAIYNQNQAIIIENKIGAEDQPKQLERYYDLIKEKGFKEIRMYYLTLWGTEPSKQSLGKLANSEFLDVDLLSYKSHIAKWIDDCIKESVLHPTLREALIQYRALISDLTGNSMSEEQKNEILELLSQGENAIKAKSIYDNWLEFKLRVEWNFWCELKKAVSGTYVISPNQSFTWDKIKKVTEGRRNAKPWYGVMFSIGTFKEYDIRVFVERGDDDVFYGLVAYQGNERITISENEDCIKLSELLNEHFEWTQTPMWLGGNFLTPKIDFEKFSDQTTFDLSKEEFRQKYVDDNLNLITRFVKKCQASLAELQDSE